MADQASLRGGDPGAGGVDRGNGRGNGNGTPEGQIVGGIAEFGNDIANLAELQAKLAMIDLKECISQVRWALALIVLGLVFILGALPVALLGLAELIAAALHLGAGWAMLLTGGVVLAVAVAAVVASALRLGSGFSSSFRRSREELTRNLAWIRTVLLYSGRGMPRRVR
jgi:uncharacterized membrane protein YqjE